MRKKMLTIHEASLLLGVCKATLRTWHRNGKLVPEVKPLTRKRLYGKDTLYPLMKYANYSGNTKKLSGIIKKQL